MHQSVSVAIVIRRGIKHLSGLYGCTKILKLYGRNGIHICSRKGWFKFFNLGWLEVCFVSAPASGNKTNFLLLFSLSILSLQRQTVYRKFETNIPRNENARPQFHILQSCFCEQHQRNTNTQTKRKPTLLSVEQPEFGKSSYTLCSCLVLGLKTWSSVGSFVEIQW